MLLDNSQSQRDNFKIALAICTFFVAPILLANNYYYDDISRSLSGGLGWSQLGRPLSDFIFMLMSLNLRSSVDITPLPLIISTLVMTHGIILLCRIFFDKQTILNILICSSVFITPFFIQNLSYRYDNLSMVVSVYLCILSFSFCRLGSVRCMLFSCFALVCSLSLYQTSFPSFCILCIGYTISLVNRGGDVYYRFIIRSFAIAIISLVFYYSITTLFFDNTSRSNLVFSRTDWLSLLYRNITNYILMLKAGLNPIGVLAGVLSLLIAATSSFYITYSSKVLTSRAEKIILGLASILAPIITLILSSLISAVTIEGFIAPRVASSFGCAVFVSLYLISLIGVRFISFSLCLVMLINSLLSCFAVSSSMKNQTTKDMFVINRVASEIGGSDKLRRVPVTFVGELNHESSVVNNSHNFGIVGLIVSPFNDWMAALTMKKISGVPVNYRMDRKGNLELSNRILASSTLSLFCNSDFSIASDGVQSVVFLGKGPSQCK